MAVKLGKLGLAVIVAMLFWAVELVLPESDYGSLAATYALVLAVSIAATLFNWPGKELQLAQFLVGIFGATSALLTAWWWVQSAGGAEWWGHAALVYVAMVVTSLSIIIALFSGSRAYGVNKPHQMAIDSLLVTMVNITSDEPHS